MAHTTGSEPDAAHETAVLLVPGLEQSGTKWTVGSQLEEHTVPEPHSWAAQRNTDVVRRTPGNCLLLNTL